MYLQPLSFKYSPWCRRRLAISKCSDDKSQKPITQHIRPGPGRAVESCSLDDDVDLLILEFVLDKDSLTQKKKNSEALNGIALIMCTDKCASHLQLEDVAVVVVARRSSQRENERGGGLWGCYRKKRAFRPGSELGVITINRTVMIQSPRGCRPPISITP